MNEWIVVPVLKEEIDVPFRNEWVVDEFGMELEWSWRSRWHFQSLIASDLLIFDQFG